MAAQGEGSGNILTCINGTWSGSQPFTSATTIGVETGAWYSNPSAKPMFVSTICPNSPFSEGYIEALDAYIADINGASWHAGHSQIQEGGSGARLAAAPFISFIVPPQGRFTIYSSAGNSSASFCQATLVN